ncbi:No apical meristem (NAM) protein [Corchorus olitorius]|uniref:No apical meristem (NAM) protein n=1 Tax=Corchorus olitorius TaxID=93759 RepID=A0A1R3KRF7_9ROSI|nr:No apical meristem (NAM) protein [Corchorus olitorius]
MAAVFPCVGDGKGEAAQSNEIIIPPGFRYSPEDYMLIESYLVNKIMGVPIPVNIIKDIDVYDCDPRQLPTSDLMHGKTNNEAYYFTKAGKTWRRTTKGGYWKATYERDISGSDGKLIGTKTKFYFYSTQKGDDGVGEKTSWVMYEFKVNPSILPTQPLDDTTKANVDIQWVVCVIRNKEDDIKEEPNMWSFYEEKAEEGEGDEDDE